MQIFYGTQNQSTGMNWVVDPSIFVATDSANNKYIVPFLDSLGLGWINCDKFYQSGTPVTFPITPLVDAERDETVDIAVYVLFPSINSAMNVSNITGTEIATASGIPAGMQAVAAIVGVGRITGKAYFGKVNFTAASQQNVSVSVVQMTDEQIYNSLSNL
jgi:hypothetical protein